MDNENNAVNTNEQVETKKNVVAIVGFIVSFFLAILGLILSIIGLIKSKKTNSGSGFSIAGIIISVFGIILKSIIIFTLVSFLNKTVSYVSSSVGCATATDCTLNEDGYYNCVFNNKNITCDADTIESRIDFNEIYQKTNETFQEAKKEIKKAKDEFVGEKGNLFNELIEALKGGYSNIAFTYTYAYDETGKELKKELNNYEKIPVVSELTLDTSMTKIDVPVETEKMIYISIDFKDSNEIPVNVKIIKSDEYTPYYVLLTKENTKEAYKTESGINLFETIKIEN